MSVFVFFFFKQKTAYEMRISDWSSDVCSSDLMDRFKTLSAVLTAEPAVLRQVPGMGEASIAALKIVTQAAERLAREEAMAGDVISSWDKLLAYCRMTMAHQKIEQFRLLFLDKRNRLIADEVQQQGTIDHTPVYTRAVVKRALELGAAPLTPAHHHPPGHTHPPAAHPPTHDDR